MKQFKDMYIRWIFISLAIVYYNATKICKRKPRNERLYEVNS